ncbi:MULTISPECIES: M24 family metallopeptidase [unclassified Halanaerobium]|uniref:M24 family metallopeptidase n=1 Tax=unclassified Halanaerobium TaxID=2641197 RepID=UPI000DF3B72B|nr:MULTISPECIES: M24 family metallopeptidase [unclassified Halanaerobium]RCW42025.1 Xaa-Pro dipeptidase [Halanaerobium sp. MA284_MarDTE_T2]RCW80736.1 Xaa-Pro dipeptidase [Halanaerobium sp. DL-01]
MLFSESEYKSRVKKTKKRMEKAGIDVLMSTHPANMNYLTGYDGWSFYVHQCVLVSLDQEEPVWIGRNMDANAAKVTTYLSSENIRNYADDYVHSPIGKHPVDYMVDVIEEKGWEDKTIGLEMDQFYFTHKTYEILAENLSKAEFKDANLLVAMVRQIKSAQEIEFMKKAGKIAEKVMQTGIESVGVGVRECDAAAEISKAQISGTDDFGGDYPAIVPLMPAGDGIDAPHLTWSDRKYEKNEPIILELSGCYNRYHAPMARTVYLGEPPKRMKEITEIVVEGLEETLDFIKPGVTCEAVEEKWRNSIAKGELVDASRLGYSFGLNYPPDWGEQTASMRPHDKTVLKENMTFHLIPIIWQDDIGFEMSSAIRVTEDGCEEFYDFPKKLFTK